MIDEKIYNVLVPSADSGDIFICDAIRYKGGLWLVPHWINNPATGSRTPTRIIRVDKLQLATGHQAFGADFAVPVLTVSTALLDGRAQPTPPIELIESPSVSFPIPGVNPEH